MAERRERLVEVEQLVDWRAAVIAGLIAGAVFLLLQMVGRSFVDADTIIIEGVAEAVVPGGSLWVAPRYIAAMVLGEEVLPPPTSFDALVFLVALLINTVLAVLFTMVLAAIIHEWEILVGIVVGALFGLALYAINYYTFSYFFPWFFAVNSWVDVVAHVLFGAVAGGLYELLETERFVVEVEYE
ncbi:MAG: hypothetical protein R3272_09130 [Candidatus Promineifilaceae bacterium]|nr:hypothetical protein [Candidatus Promineifilaceae bacterium]